MVALWLLLGALVEVFNSAVRHWSVARLGLQTGLNVWGSRWVSGTGNVSRRRSVFLFALGFVVRLSVASVVFVMAFRQDLTSGLAALVGYWIGRWVMVWRVVRRLS
jgi:hypothetical protein